ncbi:MAG: peptide-methionine (R)-S-oxide reductase [Silicimonas sp.]|nr:peptide-methionine (R)-S-oxide reductase [Silicimonas sp.]
MTKLEKIGRRGFISASVASVAVASQNRPAVGADGQDAYFYPVMRTDAEWRERLDEIEHYVLRTGGTEAPRSSKLWNNTQAGTYCCRGCDLTVYRSLQKIELTKGWAFFRHSLKDTVMTDLDLGQGMAGDPFAEMQAAMEVHCRRCGSHLGHIVALPEVKDRPIHCINGFALSFQPQSA